jgi:hypothetical protein
VDEFEMLKKFNQQGFTSVHKQCERDRLNKGSKLLELDDDTMIEWKQKQREILVREILGSVQPC